MVILGAIGIDVIVVGFGWWAVVTWRQRRKATIQYQHQLTEAMIAVLDPPSRRRSAPAIYDAATDGAFGDWPALATVDRDPAVRTTADPPLQRVVAPLGDALPQRRLAPLVMSPPAEPTRFPPPEFEPLEPGPLEPEPQPVGARTGEVPPNVHLFEPVGNHAPESLEAPQSLEPLDPLQPVEAHVAPLDLLDLLHHVDLVDPTERRVPALSDEPDTGAELLTIPLGLIPPPTDRLQDVFPGAVRSAAVATVVRSAPNEGPTIDAALETARAASVARRAESDGACVTVSGFTVPQRLDLVATDDAGATADPDGAALRFPDQPESDSSDLLLARLTALRDTPGAWVADQVNSDTSRAEDNATT